MKQYNTFVVFKRPLLCCLATFSDGTLSRERKVTLMKHSDMNVKKYCALNILKQCQYKALSGNSCSGTVIKFILFYFMILRLLSIT